MKHKDLDIGEYRKCILETKQELIKEKKDKQKIKQELLETAQILYPVVSTTTLNKTIGAGYRLPGSILFE